MGYQRFGPILPFHAGADLSSSRYLFVKVDTTQQANSVDGLAFVIVNTTSGGDCVGALEENPKQNRVASVQTYDVAKVVAGATVHAGDLIMSDGAGKAIAATGSTKFVLGRSMSEGVASDVISVQLFAAHPQLP